MGEEIVAKKASDEKVTQKEAADKATKVATDTQEKVKATVKAAVEPKVKEAEAAATSNKASMSGVIANLKEVGAGLETMNPSKDVADGVGSHQVQIFLTWDGIRV